MSHATSTRRIRPGATFGMAILALCGSFLPCNSAALGQERPVVVSVIDAAANVLERHNPTARLTVRLIAEALAPRHIKVIDADTIENRRRFGRRTAYTAHDWIRDVRRARISTDLLIALKLDDYPEHFSDGQRLHVRIHALVYTLNSSRLVYETRVTTAAGRLVPEKCAPDCRAETVADALGVTMPLLAERLAAHFPPRRSLGRTRRQGDMGLEEPHTIDLVGFEAKTIERIDDRLRSFYGYVAHETIERNPCRQRISYRTRATRSRLEQNIRRLFRELRMPEVILRFDPKHIEASRPGCRN